MSKGNEKFESCGLYKQANFQTAFFSLIFGHWLVIALVYFLVHGQVTIIFVVSVCLSVCLFVCAEFFSAVFDPISIKLGHTLYVWV